VSTNGARAELERQEEAARPKFAENPSRTTVQTTIQEGEQETLYIWRSLQRSGIDLLCRGASHGLILA